MPTMTSISPSKTGTRECRCSRSAGRIRSTGVATSRQNMSGRGTMMDRTSVSSSSKTLWIISRSSRSTTPSLAPTSTSVRSSSSESSGSPDRSLPMSRTLSAESPPRSARTGVIKIASQPTGRWTRARNRSGYFTARVIGKTSPKGVRIRIVTRTWMTRAQRRAAGALAAGGVGVAEAGGGGSDLADPREQRTRRGGEAVDEAGERARMTGHEELVILAAARRPGERVAADRRGHGPHGGAQGEPRELDPCTDPALLGDVAEVGGETVGEVDHGRHAARSGEPLALAHARRRTQVRGLHLVERRRRHARGRRPAFKHGEPGGGAAEGAGHGDDIAGLGRGPQHGGRHRLAEERHGHDPAPGRGGGVAANDRDVVGPGELE